MEGGGLFFNRRFAIGQQIELNEVMAAAVTPLSRKPWLAGARKHFP